MEIFAGSDPNQVRVAPRRVRMELAADFALTFSTPLPKDGRKRADAFRASNAALAAFIKGCKLMILLADTTLRDSGSWRLAAEKVPAGGW